MKPYTIFYASVFVASSLLSVAHGLFSDSDDDGFKPVKVDFDGKPMEGFSKLNEKLDEHVENVQRKIEAAGKTGNITPEEYKEFFFADFDDSLFTTYDETDEVKNARRDRKYEQRKAKHEKKMKKEAEARAHDL